MGLLEERNEGPQKEQNFAHKDSITVICAKKVLQWHLAMLYLVYCFTLKKHIQILGKNMFILPCLQSGFRSKGPSQSFWTLGFNLYERVKKVETEVEMSGQTVWDPWAEGMEIIMGKKCLTAIKVKGNLWTAPKLFFPNKTYLDNSILFLLFLIGLFIWGGMGLWKSFSLSWDIYLINNILHAK